MSLAGGVLRVVEDAARREGFVRVKLLRLAVGALAGVELEALRFALQAIAPGTLLDGARLEIDTPPGTAWCLRCSATVPVSSRIDLCPQCGGAQLQPTGGTELQVVELRVEDAPAAEPARGTAPT